MATHESISTVTLKNDYDNLRSPESGYKRTLEQIARHQESFELQIQFIRSISKEQNVNKNNLSSVYPSAGLIHTNFDNLGPHEHALLNDDQIIETLRMRTFFLTLFNHPYRTQKLFEVNSGNFTPPPLIGGSIFEAAAKEGFALSIGDIASSITGGNNQERMSRTDIYARGLFIKLGKQARIPFVGSESPDVWNSTMAVATMAASHALCSIPRDGVLSDIKRQTEFAKEVFWHLDNIAEIILEDRPDRELILQMWKKNVLGTVEPTSKKALKRAEELAKVGIMGFRPYSPEPGNAIVDTACDLKEYFGDDYETATGQIVSVDQGERAEKYSDVEVGGVAGGGRCITGVRSVTAVDWPELVWNARGKIRKPLIIQGGGSDHVATTLLLGASGIGVSRIVAGGTIESPGGALYCIDENGKPFKPYGGEASARNKQLADKVLPFGIPSFVEGETTKAYANYLENALPTLTYNLHRLLEDATLSLVFRGASDIGELQAIDPSPLKRITAAGDFQRNTH